MWLSSKDKVSNNKATLHSPDINDGTISCRDNYLLVEGPSSSSNFGDIHPKRCFHGNFLLVYGVTCLILSGMLLHGVGRI